MAEYHTKTTIIDISLNQFLTHGIRKMTVQKLVAPLGISTKTVYKYFSDKEDLLAHCLLLQYQRMSDDLMAMMKNNSNPVITLAGLWYQAIELDFGVNRIFYHDLNYYYPELQDKILKKNRKHWDAILLETLDHGKQAGFFRKDILPAIFLEAASILYSSITRTEHFKKYRITPQEIVRNTVEIYVRGICTVKGLKEMEHHYSLISKNKSNTNA
jgi:AcrR family transcriptional regulator